MDRNWIVVAALILVTTFAFVVWRGFKEAQDKAKQKELENKTKRRNDEVKYGYYIRRALEEHNRNGKFAIEGGWFEGRGYVIEVNRPDQDPTLFNPIRIFVDATGGLKAIELRIGQVAYYQSTLDCDSAKRVTKRAKGFMDIRISF